MRSQSVYLLAIFRVQKLLPFKSLAAHFKIQSMTFLRLYTIWSDFLKYLECAIASAWILGPPSTTYKRSDETNNAWLASLKTGRTICVEVETSSFFGVLHRKFYGRIACECYASRVSEHREKELFCNTSNSRAGPPPHWFVLPRIYTEFLLVVDANVALASFNWKIPHDFFGLMFIQVVHVLEEGNTVIQESVEQWIGRAMVTSTVGKFWLCGLSQTKLESRSQSNYQATFRVSNIKAWWCSLAVMRMRDNMMKKRSDLIKFLLSVRKIFTPSRLD